jgi:hypothetical protein
VEEIIAARRLLEIWTAQAKDAAGGAANDGAAADRGAAANPGPANAAAADALAERGRALLAGDAAETAGLLVRGERMEKSRRETIIVHPREGYEAYGEMLHYYAALNLIAWLEADGERTYQTMCGELDGPRCTRWVNLGGQLAPETEVDALRGEIGAGTLATWDAVHERYNELWARYPAAKQRHAFAVYRLLHGDAIPDAAGWDRFLSRAVEIQQLRRDRVRESRKKDYDNPFRFATYRSKEEMLAALGSIEDNRFVQQVREETEVFRRRVDAVRERG